MREKIQKHFDIKILKKKMKSSKAYLELTGRQQEGDIFKQTYYPQGSLPRRNFIEMRYFGKFSDLKKSIVTEENQSQINFKLIVNYTVQLYLKFCPFQHGILN